MKPVLTQSLVNGGLFVAVGLVVVFLIIRSLVDWRRAREVRRMLKEKFQIDHRLGLEDLVAHLVRLNKESISALEMRVVSLETRLRELGHADGNGDLHSPLPPQEQIFEQPVALEPIVETPKPKPVQRPRAPVSAADRQTLSNLEQAYKAAVGQMSAAAFDDFMETFRAEPLELSNGALQRGNENVAPLIGVSLSSTTSAILPSWVIIESFPTIYRFERSMPEAVRSAFDLSTGGSGRLTLLSSAQATTEGGRLVIVERGHLDGLSI